MTLVGAVAAARFMLLDDLRCSIADPPPPLPLEMALSSRAGLVRKGFPISWWRYCPYSVVPRFFKDGLGEDQQSQMVITCNRIVVIL